MIIMIIIIIIIVIIEQVDPVNTTALLSSARILRRVLDT